MTDEAKGSTLQIWVGRFPSLERQDTYFEKTYAEAEDDEELEDDELEDDEEFSTASEFAAGQGVWFYDHDFLERSFSPVLVTDLRPLLERHSFSTSYIEEAVAAYNEEPTPVNTLVLFTGEGIKAPRSAAGDDFELRYLGEFEYQPSCASVWAERLSVVPDRVQLELQTPGSLHIGGAAVPHLTIDHRGLVIGSGGAAGDQPYLDLSTLPDTEALAPAQVRIYRDEFGQWVLEDQGRNGLTAIASTTLNGERAMPWHQDRIQLGSVRFQWNCFPELDPPGVG